MEVGALECAHFCFIHEGKIKKRQGVSHKMP